MCLVTACLPVILPWRAREQHKNITELYPVESTGTRKVDACVERVSKRTMGEGGRYGKRMIKW